MIKHRRWDASDMWQGTCQETLNTSKVLCRGQYADPDKDDEKIFSHDTYVSGDPVKEYGQHNPGRNQAEFVLRTLLI